MNSNKIGIQKFVWRIINRYPFVNEISCGEEAWQAINKSPSGEKYIGLRREFVIQMLRL